MVGPGGLKGERKGQGGRQTERGAPRGNRGEQATRGGRGQKKKKKEKEKGQIGHETGRWEEEAERRGEEGEVLHWCPLGSEQGFCFRLILTILLYMNSLREKNIHL